ncbi:MAG: hypothetical protein JWQ74_2662 [Marmoricola sp.]|nr:hypothetical protein [Marmoricola sp.]
MRFLLAGASGFLGSRLSDSLRLAGHEVTALVRREAGPGQARWDPYGAGVDQALIEDADVVVNLAGSPTLGNPHSKKWAAELRHSRVTTTRVLAEAIAASPHRPAFLAGNGISYYGDHGDELLTEAADTRGDALLTSVTREWQAATDVAAEAGARVCVLRTSPVMDRHSAPLKQQLLLFKAGLGGKLGSGEQYFPIISTQDWVAAVTFLAEHDDVRGPVNLCCPKTPTNAEFTRELSRLVHRPAVARVPGFVLKQAAGKMAPEVLGSVRALPQVLTDSGFRFADADVTGVLASATA